MLFVFTEALTDPVAILDKFNPTIAEAGISNKLAPDPEKVPLIKNIDPVNEEFPTAEKDPDTNNEPEISKDPELEGSNDPEGPGVPGAP